MTPVIGYTVARIVRPGGDERHGFVIGYRAWDVVTRHWHEPQGLLHRRCVQRPILSACTRSYLWKPGNLTAKCSLTAGVKTGVPHINHGCGFYAWNRATAGHAIYGAILGWGRVIHGEWGWRAQHARVIALWDMIEHAKELSDYYRVPLLRTHKALEAYALEFGEHA